MLQIHFRRCLSHMRFASSNSSRWEHCSIKKYTHFLIILSKSHQHGQRPQTFALKWDSKWLWHVGRDFFFQLYSWSRLDGVRPILFLKIFHINIWNCWVKYKFRVHVLFQISKHMKDLLQISLAWQRPIRGHHRYLIGDINAAKLYNLSEDAYQIMVVG